MKLLKKILAFWGVFVFGITSIFVFFIYIPCFLLVDYKQASYYRLISNRWLRFVLFMSGCAVKVKGQNHFDSGKNYIIIANHRSNFDPIITSCFMPNPSKTIGKVEFAKIPIFGYIYKFGAILVDRKDIRTKVKSFMEMERVLKNGMDMLIYPEGTRNKTNQPLIPFHNGAFKLAVKTGKSIIPLLIYNSHKVFSSTEISLNPGTVYAEFLSPIESKNINAEELSNKCFQLMYEKLIRYDK